MSVEEVKARITSVTDRLDQESPTQQADETRVALAGAINKMGDDVEVAVRDALILNEGELLDISSMCLLTTGQAEAAQAELNEAAGNSVNDRAGAMLVSIARHKKASEQLMRTGDEIAAEMHTLLQTILAATESIRRLGNHLSVLEDESVLPTLESTKQQAIQDAQSYRDSL